MWHREGPEGVVHRLARADEPLPDDLQLDDVRAAAEAVLPGNPDGRQAVLAVVENHLLSLFLDGAAWAGRLYDALRAGQPDPFRRWLPPIAAETPTLRQRFAAGRVGTCHYPAYLDPVYRCEPGDENGFVVRQQVTLIERQHPDEPAVSLAPWSPLVQDFEADPNLAETLERFVNGFLADRLPPAALGYCLVLELEPDVKTWPPGWRRPVVVRGDSVGLAVAVAAVAAVTGRPPRRAITTGAITDASGVWKSQRVGPNKLRGKREAVTRFGRLSGDPVLFLVDPHDAVEQTLRSTPQDGFRLNARPGDDHPLLFGSLDELFGSAIWQDALFDPFTDYRAMVQNEWAVDCDPPTQEVTQEALASLADTRQGTPPPAASVVSADYETDSAELTRVLVRELLSATDRLALPLALELEAEDLADDDELAAAVCRTLARLGVTGVNAEAVRRVVRHDPIWLVAYHAGGDTTPDQLRRLGRGRWRDGDRVRKRLLTSGLRVRPTDIIEAGFVDIPPAGKNRPTSA